MKGLPTLLRFAVAKSCNGDDAIVKLVLSSSVWAGISRRPLVPWVLSFAELREDAEVLEIVCRSGAETIEFAQWWPRWQLTATDYDPEMVGRAKGRLPRLQPRIRVEQGR